ncbi:MAG TPA: molybdopterin-guanine dinucleotide biosynthesis protein B [Methanocorpusculum sp.]|nr:molybdopterin-guanine dinucleotide biosynthesis protein B [Methanocorpusculum sp.]
MRVISITGYSNSGKTTFITRLIPELAKTFKVASIKHMGHHVFELPEGKDTTLHFASGAACSAGIDKEKTVLTLEGTDMYTVLDIYAYLGYDYTVVEGFKDAGFPCAVIGDLDVPSAIMRNPSVDEVVRRADEFMEYVPHRKTD